METKLFDGRRIRDQVLVNLKTIPSKTLCLVNLGLDSAGDGYAKAVKQLAKKLAVPVEEHLVPADWSLSRVKRDLEGLLGRPALTEYVLNFSAQAEVYPQRQFLLDLVLPSQDADYLASRCLTQQVYFPSVVRAVLKAIEVGADVLEPAKAKVAILGYRGFWGRRIMWALRQADWMGVEGVDKNGLDRVNQADLIVSCVGQPKLVTAKMVKKGAAVIDVGYSFAQGRIWGDVDKEAVKGRAAFLTPVPGGIGPLSIAYLFDNFSQAKGLK